MKFNSGQKSSSELHQNEIRDYVNRAPRRSYFDGARMIYTTHARLKWLTEIAHGTINDRINRRAGIKDDYQPWKTPPWIRACNRHKRNELRKRGLTSFF